MVHEGIFATSQEIKDKAGSGVSTAGSTEAFINQLAKEIEGFVNVLTRENFSTLFSTLTIAGTGILTQIETNYCAFFMTKFDTSGYGSIREAENDMNTNWAVYIQGMGLLKNQEAVTFIKKQTS